MELIIDRVRTDPAGVQVAPDREQTVIVRAPTLGAGTVPRRERRRLVEEEQLRVAAGLQQRASPPAAELEPARDPALHRERPANATVGVVQAATIAVDEAAGRIR